MRREILRRTAIVAMAAGVLAIAAAPLVAQEREFINRRRQARVIPLQTPNGLFLAYCAPCHGAEATGRGRFWVAELTPRPADLTTLGADQGYLLETIRNGSQSHGKSNLCPPWGLTLSDADVQRLALYVLELDQTSVVSDGPVAVAPILPAQPFPWMLLVVLLTEGVIVWFLFRRQRRLRHVVP